MNTTNNTQTATPAAPGAPGPATGALDNLNLLEQEALQQDQRVAEQAQQQGEQKATAADLDEAARKGAAMAVGFCEALVQMKWDFVNIPAPLHDALIAKATPVVKKRAGGGKLPEWLEPYREEVELGAVVLATGAVILVQVRAHEAQAKANAEQAAKNGERATTGAARQPEQAPAKAPVTPIRSAPDTLDPNPRG